MNDQITSFIQKSKEIQTCILNFINDQKDIEENFEKITKLFKDNKIQESKQEVRSVVHLISKISNNHYRVPNFIQKIEQILTFLLEDIKKYFSNKEIFNFFKSNKRILLFLFDKKIITPDEYIYKTITNDKYKQRFYPEYFFKEFNSFYSCQFITEIKSTNNEIESDIYDEKRRIGENDSEICKLIQNDSIEEFITYVNKNFIQVQNLTVKPSIYETNSYLLKKLPTIFEYTAFFGSMQIFRYLYLNKAVLTPSIWLYSIHGEHPEMINFLQENYSTTMNYFGLIEEAIKCHHNDIINYIQNNFLQNNDNVYSNLFYLLLKYYNFLYFPNIMFNELVFYNMCKFDYVSLVNILIQTLSLNLNMIII